MEVRELQHRPATTCRPSTPIHDVARIMSKDNVGSVLVVDEHDALRGIVTDRDIVVRAVAGEIESDTPVGTVMTRNVVFLFEDADVATASTKMAERGFRRLPVLDLGGHLTGVVSFDDLVIALSDQIARLANAVRKEIVLPR